MDYQETTKEIQRLWNAGQYAEAWDLLRRFCLFQTREWVRANQPELLDQYSPLDPEPKGKEAKAEKPKLSDKATEMLRIILEQSSFEHYEAGLVEVLSLLMDEPLMLQEYIKRRNPSGPNPTSSPSYLFGMMVIPLENHNSHNYPLGAPCLIIDARPLMDYAIRTDGIIGNHLPSAVDVRPALPGEIEAWFTEELRELVRINTNIERIRP